MNEDIIFSVVTFLLGESHSPEDFEAEASVMRKFYQEDAISSYVYEDDGWFFLMIDGNRVADKPSQWKGSLREWEDFETKWFVVKTFEERNS